MGEEDYLSYEVIDVEETLTESGAFMYWKDGVEYQHIGWLRFTGRACRFQKYRSGTERLVAVEQATVCEDCIRRVRDLARARGIELAELRARWNVPTLDSCRSASPASEC